MREVMQASRQTWELLHTERSRQQRCTVIVRNLLLLLTLEGARQGRPAHFLQSSYNLAYCCFVIQPVVCKHAAGGKPAWLLHASLQLVPAHQDATQQR